MKTLSFAFAVFALALLLAGASSAFCIPVVSWCFFEEQVAPAQQNNAPSSPQAPPIPAWENKYPDGNAPNGTVLCSSGVGNSGGFQCVNDCPPMQWCTDKCTCADRKFRACSSGPHSDTQGNAKYFCRDDCIPTSEICDRATCECIPRIPVPCSGGTKLENWSYVCKDDCPSDSYCFKDGMECACKKKTTKLCSDAEPGNAFRAGMICKDDCRKGEACRSD